VIAWGESLGGLITAGLVQDDPARFSGALPLCGPLAGTVAGANGFRDLLFAFKRLAAPHAYATRYIILGGTISLPVLSMHTVGDR
jgi:alpha-beta hydrolase superfamily lysophospholipase